MRPARCARARRPAVRGRAARGVPARRPQRLDERPRRRAGGGRGGRGRDSAAGTRLRCSVVAFASEPLVLLDPTASPGRSTAVVDDLLSLRGHGTTDLARALRVAAEQLEHVPPGGRTALLLSDALHTKGRTRSRLPPGCSTACTCWARAPSPTRSPRAALARRGRGRFLPATTLAELTASLQLILA